jgi:Fe-S-cluster containining protein
MTLQELPETAPDTPSWREGLAALKAPVWPLCNLGMLLYMTSPCTRMEELLQELPSPVEILGVTYHAPSGVLAPLLDVLRLMEVLKTGETDTVWPVPPILTPEGQGLDPMEAAIIWIKQAVIERELERINSLLCGPCSCTLCCTGPDGDARQEYFEIPLSDREIPLFPLPAIDTAHSRSLAAEAEPELTVEGVPFFRRPPALYHWSGGWSLILPRGSRCPNLTADGACRVYPTRPDVCRRPQIFPVVLERPPVSPPEGAVAPWTRRESLLAVWDCPYVRELKDPIIRYAERNELEPVFRENKA